jgi:hypothetical protein
MRKRHFAVGAACALLFGVVAGHLSRVRASSGRPQNSASNACERACLNGFVDQYLDAIVMHDPSHLPVAKSIKFTENGQRLELGDGLWRTATGRGGYRFYIDDPQAGEVGFLGTMQEAGQPVIMALRLRIESEKISEVETIVARGQMAANGAQNLEKLGAPRHAFLEATPATERASRVDLIMTANKYFSGMQQDDGKHDYSFFADDCARLENGMQTTNNPNPRPGASANAAQEPVSRKYDPALKPKMYSSAWSCADQFRSGLLHFVTRIRDRRFPVVDQERGIVFSFIFFDHSAGDTRNFQTPDGRSISAGPTTPFTWEIAEIFKVEEGQLHQIEAVLNQAPYGMGSGWSNWADSMSDKPKW